MISASLNLAPRCGLVREYRSRWLTWVGMKAQSYYWNGRSARRDLQGNPPTGS
jgi:hypothetical protein